MTDQPTHPPPLEYVPAPPPDSDFDRAFAQVIGLEGGYNWDVDDYGGETKFGISKRSYPELDIKNLTLEQAASIYLRDYWGRMRLPEVENYEIAAELFEQGVNLGTGTAITNLQRSLNLVNGSVTVDGVIGPETMAAVNDLSVEQIEALLKCLNGFQFKHYIDLVEDYPRQRKFMIGWLKRLS